MRYLATLPLICASAAYGQACDCTTYPFKPERCFSECVKKLSAKPAEIERVRDIDPGVSVGIRVLSQSREPRAVDLDKVRDKPTLERAALEALKRGGKVEK